MGHVLRSSRPSRCVWDTKAQARLLAAVEGQLQLRRPTGAGVGALLVQRRTTQSVVRIGCGMSMQRLVMLVLLLLLWKPLCRLLMSARLMALEMAVVMKGLGLPAVRARRVVRRRRALRCRRRRSLAVRFGAQRVGVGQHQLLLEGGGRLVILAQHWDLGAGLALLCLLASAAEGSPLLRADGPETVEVALPQELDGRIGERHRPERC
jgi:hypothetical protein